MSAYPPLARFILIAALGLIVLGLLVEWAPKFCAWVRFCRARRRCWRELRDLNERWRGGWWTGE